MIEGIDGVDARQGGKLALAGLVDGGTWELLDPLDLGLTDMREVGLVAAPDGSIVVIGWGQWPTDVGFKTFVVHVSRTPG